MIKRLRRRFIRIAMISVALVLVLLTVILNVANYISTDTDLTQTLELICDNQGTIPLHPQMPSPADDGTGEAPERPEKPWGEKGGAFTSETPFSTRFFVLRYTDAGVLTQAELGNIAAVTEDDTPAFLEKAIAHGEGYGYYAGYKFYVVRTGEDRNMAVFLDCFQQLRAVRSVAVWSLIADAGCIALVYLLVVLLSRRAIDPVVRSAEQQKQFITDASHELKTPLTVITTDLKVLEMEVGQQKWIDKALAQVKKMSGLVNALVTLSRMDEEEPPLTLSDFDLSAAVEDTAESFRDAAVAAGHALTLDIEPAVACHGDEAALRQLVSILLDNAVKYASSGGDIELSLKREHRAAVLRSSNPAAPLSEEETKRLFDRFYRPDKSRTSATGGFGVGLSIARGIAEAHHGSIAARYADGRLAFTAVLK